MEFSVRHWIPGRVPASHPSAFLDGARQRQDCPLARRAGGHIRRANQLRLREPDRQLRRVAASDAGDDARLHAVPDAPRACGTCCCNRTTGGRLRPGTAPSHGATADPGTVGAHPPDGLTCPGILRQSCRHCDQRPADAVERLADRVARLGRLAARKATERRFPRYLGDHRLNRPGFDGDRRHHHLADPPRRLDPRSDGARIEARDRRPDGISGPIGLAAGRRFGGSGAGGPGRRRRFGRCLSRRDDPGGWRSGRRRRDGRPEDDHWRGSARGPRKGRDGVRGDRAPRRSGDDPRHTCRDRHGRRPDCQARRTRRRSAIRECRTTPNASPTAWCYRRWDWRSAPPPSPPTSSAFFHL